MKAELSAESESLSSVIVCHEDDVESVVLEEGAAKVAAVLNVLEVAPEENPEDDEGVETYEYRVELAGMGSGETDGTRIVGVVCALDDCGFVE